MPPFCFILTFHNMCVKDVKLLFFTILAAIELSLDQQAIVIKLIDLQKPAST
jgi:hypothetical protein